VTIGKRWEKLAELGRRFRFSGRGNMMGYGGIIE